MPRIFDNVDTELVPALEQILPVSESADLHVGYFNLQEWKHLDSLDEKWLGPDEHKCHRRARKLQVNRND